MTWLCCIARARQLCSGIHKVQEKGVGQEIHGDELHWMKVGSAAGVTSGLSQEPRRLEKICRQPMFLMELRTLLLLLLLLLFIIIYYHHFLSQVFFLPWYFSS
jgi:prolipoprotein diacylglyceryltransferase